VFDPVRSLFDVGTEVDVQILRRSVVVIQACCRCSNVVVVRCSDVLFQILFDDSRTSRTLFHTKCTVWNRDGNWTSVRYLYDFWGVGDRPPVQAPIERWEELADSRYRGKVASTHASRRRWAELDPSRAWEIELYRRSVLSAAVWVYILRIWPSKLVNCMN